MSSKVDGKLTMKVTVMCNMYHGDFTEWFTIVVVFNG